MVAAVTHTIHVGDTLKPLGVTLTRTDGTAVDVTGLTVKFKAVGLRGEEVIAETETGVSVTDAEGGEVQYDFQDADVQTARTYYGYFVVLDGNDERETFPVEEKQLVINVSAD